MAIDPSGKRLQHIALRNRRKVRVGDERWPLDKKMQAVKHWLIFGDLSRTGRDLGIPEGTIRKWKASQWWGELAHEVRTSQNIEMDSKLTKIVNKSLEETMDRLENGDFIYDQKTGQIRRKPAALRDVHRVSVDLMQRREALREGANDRKETAQISVKEQLSMLAQEFAKWVDKDKGKPVIDVEMVEIVEEDDDALHEEREARLQAGSGEIHEPPGSHQEENSAERSPEGSGEAGPSPKG